MTVDDAHVPRSFRQFVRHLDESGTAIDAAFLVDRIFNPDVDEEAGMAYIEGLGEEYAARVASHFDPMTKLEELGGLLGQDLGFRGDGSDFRNPNRSFLHDVLESRRGLPISLSVLYMAVAEHAGVALHGIGLPGHFVVGMPHVTPPLFLDPFRGGRSLTRQDCDRIVRQVTGHRTGSAEGYLKPTTTRGFLTRMLNNLQMVYWQQRDNIRGLLATRMLCLVNPGAAEPVKARAFFYDRLGDSASALADYDAYIRRAHRAPDARQIQQRISHLRAALRESDLD